MDAQPARMGINPFGHDHKFKLFIKIKDAKINRTLRFLNVQLFGVGISKPNHHHNLSLELKVGSAYHNGSGITVGNYLTASPKDVGSIINFGERKVEIKRKVGKLPQLSELK